MEYGTTLNKLAYDLLNIVRGGQIADDETLSLRQVKFWINNTRALLIRRDLDKGRSINPDIIQSIPCMNIIQVDASECNCQDSGCYTTRTIRKIPHAIELQQQNLITRVGPTNPQARAYPLISYHRVPWALSNPTTNALIRSFLYNEYIYLITKNSSILSTIEKISISGVFEDPTELETFSNCAATLPCYTDDDTYPISAVMIEQMKQMIIQNNLKIASNAPTDNTNDGKNDLQPPTTQKT